MEVFGSSGVRGTVGKTITPTFIGQIARAAGSEWHSAGNAAAAIARDTRRTGEMLADAAAAELASVGCDVRRLGVVPTPGTQAYCAREGVPALMITASHNPPRYNGVKPIGPDGHELSRDALERIESRLLRSDRDGRGSSVAWDRVGRTARVDGTRRRYIEELLSAVDREAIAVADLTVALDPGHGAGATTSPEFLRKLGCEVVTVNAQPDGDFPGRDPEPVEENLSELGELVRAADADVGIAHDGDADRAIFFDEHGAYLEGDAVLAALAAAVLEPGDAAVSAVNVSQRLVDVASEAGADLELTPIGSTYIVTRILELIGEGRRVPIAGEGNGGVLFPPYRPARDGAYTAARFLELLTDRQASEVVAPYDDYENVRVNLSYEESSTKETMLEATERYAREADAELTTIDGYRLDYGDAWVLARPSGTEPLVRVYAEARSRDRASELAAGMREALETAVEGTPAD
jgi:phosphomannomutase/phosphoglucomutase